MTQKLKAGSEKKVKKSMNTKKLPTKKALKIQICIVSTTTAVPDQNVTSNSKLNELSDKVNTPFVTKNWGNI